MPHARRLITGERENVLNDENSFDGWRITGFEQYKPNVVRVHVVKYGLSKAQHKIIYVEELGKGELNNVRSV